MAVFEKKVIFVTQYLCCLKIISPRVATRLIGFVTQFFTQHEALAGVSAKNSLLWQIIC